MSIVDQWIRKVGLFLYSNGEVLDFSEFHIKFSVINADVESPNNAAIRVYNPSKSTLNRIVGKKEFTSVVLNAGYESGNYGVIFSGTIKQLRIGHEDNVTSYIDILASDGDIGYNQGLINTTLAKGTTYAAALEESAKAMAPASDLTLLKVDKQHTPSIRGQVMFGLARSKVRNLASSLDASWSIQDGVVVVTDYAGYDDSDIIQLNAMTGLIGFPEQTDGGIHIKCLLNPRIRIGGAVELNNDLINKMVEADPESAPLSFDSYSLYNLAPISEDGVYRVFVVEFEGDTRGQSWYTKMVGLAVNKTLPVEKGVVDG
jgi:hypothetical protein